MRETCLPGGLTRDELDRIDERMIVHLKKVRRGETLFRGGDRFESLFAVWTGFFKTVITSIQAAGQGDGDSRGLNHSSAGAIRAPGVEYMVCSSPGTQKNPSVAGEAQPVTTVSRMVLHDKA